MAIKDILTSGANVNITISANDLRTFLAEVAQEVVNKEKAAEAAAKKAAKANEEKAAA